MLSGSPSDSSVAYKSKKLTLNDVHKLQKVVFDDKTHVSIHADTLDENALHPLCDFLKHLKCAYITIYFEIMDYDTALFIYQALMQNPHTLKVKLDLGEQFLGYLSACPLNNTEAQDIFDHLICGIYANVQCLALHYHSINYFQIDKLVKGLNRAPLKKLIMKFDWLDELSMTRLNEKLPSLQLTKEIELTINGANRLQLPPIESADLPVFLPASTSSVDAEPALEVEINCWQKTLTWMMSKLSCRSIDTVVLNKPTSSHYKLS